MLVSVLSVRYSAPACRSHCSVELYLQSSILLLMLDTIKIEPNFSLKIFGVANHEDKVALNLKVVGKLARQALLLC